MLKLKRKHRLCKTYSWYQKQKGVFHILKGALLLCPLQPIDSLNITNREIEHFLVKQTCRQIVFCKYFIKPFIYPLTIIFQQGNERVTFCVYITIISISTTL